MECKNVRMHERRRREREMQDDEHVQGMAKESDLSCPGLPLSLLCPCMSVDVCVCLTMNFVDVSLLSFVLSFS